MTLKVFVVDDNEDIRTSLSRALGKRGYTVETFSSAHQFLEAYDGTQEGCLVLDYGMPGMHGLELQRQLGLLGYSIPIIFITGHGGVAESVKAIKAGALDFLEKPFRQSELVELIEAAFDLVRTRIAEQEEAQRQQARFDRLTAREMEIVDWIVENPARTSSKEVAAHLGISPRTVDHHRARIFEKLGVNSVTALVALVHG